MKSRHLSDELIQEFLDSGISLPAEAGRHLQECAECRQTVEAYRELFVSLRGDYSSPLSPAFGAQVMERVSRLSPKAHSTKVVVPQWLWIGGTVVAAVGISALAMGPTALQNLLVQFHGLWSSSVNDVQAGTSKYLADFDLKPMTAMLSATTLGGIILMDRLLVRVRRGRRLMSLIA